jgi:ABC-type uncharacterized transport system auxiliary subunit
MKFARLNPVRIHSARLTGLFAVSVLMLGLSGCMGSSTRQAPTQLDLGAAAPAPAKALTPNPPVSVPAASSAALLNETLVIWRVGDQGQPQAYTTFQWVAPPARLITQKLIDRLSLQGAVLTQNVGGELPQLRVTLQRFEQTFAPNGGSSQAQLTLQVVLMKGTKVVDQLLIDLKVPAPTQDAQGGAQALRQASDQAAEQVAQWLTTTLKR